jgi:hypothetical protein
MTHEVTATPEAQGPGIEVGGRRRLEQRRRALPPLGWVSVLTLACLLPFLAKAFHVDDTLFLRTAAQIQKHPLDFYGFTINWYGTTQSVIRNMDNPPLASYYLALLATLGGWSEPVLHFGFLLPALAAISGTFSLAKRYCSKPVLAASIAVLTPVFLISGTTLMCDSLLLAFWVWAVFFFERGLQTNAATDFIISGVLTGLAFWTKYTGLALVPLLTAYAVCRRYPGLLGRALKRPEPTEESCRSQTLNHAGTFGRSVWLLTPLLSLFFLAAYEWLTFRLYGKGLFLASALDAAAIQTPEHGGFVGRQLVGLVFLGGCFLPILFYAPLLWSWRKLRTSLVLGLICGLACSLWHPFRPYVWQGQGHPDWVLLLQTTLFIAGGIHLAFLAAADLWQRREPSSVLLMLWSGGIFAFATVFNWTCNGRSLLPMLPAIALLVARRLEHRTPPGLSLLSWRVLCPALLALVVSLVVAQADYDLAETGRIAAKDLCAKYGHLGRRLWFEEHWGFQYYMEHGGAKPLELDLSQIQAGDLVVIPTSGYNAIDPPCNLFRIVDMLKYNPNQSCSTQSSSAGAGFYAASIGPYPFSMGHVNPECFYVFEVVQTLADANRSGGFSLTGAVAEQYRLEHQAVVWQQAIRSNPNDVEAHFQLGKFFASRSDFSAATRHFSEVLRLRPDDKSVRAELTAISLRASGLADARNNR